MKRAAALPSLRPSSCSQPISLHEVLTPTPFHHVRPPACSSLAGAIAVALLILAPRVPSLGVALGAGIAAGGALGTLVSGFAWDGVPDPFVHGASPSTCPTSRSGWATRCCSCRLAPRVDAQGRAP